MGRDGEGGFIRGELMKQHRLGLAETLEPRREFYKQKEGVLFFFFLSGA